MDRLYDTVWTYCMILYATVCYCTDLLYDTVCYCMLLYATVCYCMLLYTSHDSYLKHTRDIHRSMQCGESSHEASVRRKVSAWGTRPMCPPSSSIIM